MKTKDEGDGGFISYFSQHSWFLWRLIILIHKHSLPVLLDSIFETILKTADVFLVASDIIISLFSMNETPVYFTEEKGHFKIRQPSNTWIIRLKKVLLVASAIFG